MRIKLRKGKATYKVLEYTQPEVKHHQPQHKHVKEPKTRVVKVYCKGVLIRRDFVISTDGQDQKMLRRSHHISSPLISKGFVVAQIYLYLSCSVTYLCLPDT